MATATAETTLNTQKTTENSQQKQNKRKRKSQHKRDAASAVDRFDSLRWNPSLPSDEHLSLFVGTNELEGGFLSLEEIDEPEYGIGIREHGVASKKQKVKKNDNKAAEKGEFECGDVEGSLAESPEEEEEEEEVVEAVEEKAKDKKKKKKKKKNKSEKTEALDTSVAVGSDEDELEDDSVVETEFYAWNDLRLHPLLMKSIIRLGFREPTPIQKACIPAASHQGKDVVGAAETGSGKTLAFGLPILQRLLEERLKVERIFEDKGEAAEIYAPRGVLRALIITPTRELALQVTEHIKEVAKGTNLRVVPIVGGMSSEKQERLLKARPEIVIGTPGRLWELMSGGEKHLLELHSLSFFVLDEADRMIENGHFRELQSIIEMLPGTASSEGQPENSKDCVTVSSSQRKKRQTLVFSATLSLSADFRKKLKRGSLKANKTLSDDLNSIESLSERAGMRPNAAIIDLTNASILAEKIEEAFIECNEENKDAYLYYILSVHGQGRTIVFCTSIAALRHISSLLRILGIDVWTLHAQMQQRARLKAVDRFRGNENAILVATDVAARGLDIQNVRSVVHYQLPHSADVYVHRSGRTGRAFSDGCSIALISSSDTAKFASLCKSFSKESFKRFPLDESYMPEVLKRLSLARQIDKMLRKESQEKAKKTWYERNAESLDLILEKDDSEDERVNNIKRNKINSMQLKKLQQELKSLLSCPIQPKTFSRRYFAGAGISTLLQHQIEELAGKKGDNHALGENHRKLVVIGQDCVEPLQALRNASNNEVNMAIKDTAGNKRNAQSLRRKRKDEKKRLRDQRRKKRKIAQGKDD